MVRVCGNGQMDSLILVAGKTTRFMELASTSSVTSISTREVLRTFSKMELVMNSFPTERSMRDITRMDCHRAKESIFGQPSNTTKGNGIKATVRATELTLRAETGNTRANTSKIKDTDMAR